MFPQLYQELPNLQGSGPTAPQQTPPRSSQSTSIEFSKKKIRLKLQVVEVEISCEP